jgi:hypothetical protein
VVVRDPANVIVGSGEINEAHGYGPSPPVLTVDSSFPVPALTSDANFSVGVLVGTSQVFVPVATITIATYPVTVVGTVELSDAVYEADASALVGTYLATGEIIEPSKVVGRDTDTFEAASEFFDPDVVVAYETDPDVVVATTAFFDVGIIITHPVPISIAYTGLVFTGQCTLSGTVPIEVAVTLLSFYSSAYVFVAIPYVQYVPPTVVLVPIDVPTPLPATLAGDIMVMSVTMPVDLTITAGMIEGATSAAVPLRQPFAYALNQTFSPWSND